MPIHKNIEIRYKLKYEKITLKELGVTVELSTFAPADRVAEQHAILHVAPCGQYFAGQFSRIAQAEQALLSMPQCAGARIIFKRYFLSDATNQAPIIREREKPGTEMCSVSCIEQAPLDGSKVATWLYLVHDTTNLLKGYEETLQRFDATLADNCIRTWFYVRDVDTQYAGMVRARRENFVEQGLTPDTHFIASTGIGGSPADTRALVQLGTYALVGFQPAQQRYLYAKTHLNSTYEYGVTFERGTLMEYGDRQHVYISGTASINNKGEVVHVGDIVRQTERMWENVGALLAEAGSGFDDIAHLIVYLRDISDYDIVRELFCQRFPEVPCVITLAPVCRPTWLIEMECVAIKEHQNPEFRDF